MAEFKLGRIKFVYQGAWTTGTAYVVDDVVSVSGKTYICVQSHTASALFATDLASNPTNWNLVADGSKWTGNWTNNTYYNLGDQVQYGGIVYLCTSSHTSVATSASISVTGASGTGSTATITFAAQPVQPFLVGSSITVAGITTTASGYNATATVTACTTTSVSYTNATTATYTSGGTIVGTNQTGLEANQNAWASFAANLNWLGAWTTNTRFKARDLVTYGGYTYICNTPHISANTAALGLEADTSKWDTFNAGFVYQNTWSGSSVRYKLNDVVTYGADLWICTTAHTSTGSVIDGTKFTIFVNGFEFSNSWAVGTNYVVGDMVTYGGYVYTALQNNIGLVPTTNSAQWQPFTTGMVFQGDWLSSSGYKVGSVVRLNGYTYLSVADSQNSTFTITATTVSSDGTRPNQITANSTANLVPNLPVIFSGTTFGNLVSGTTYFVNQIVDATHFTVSATSGGTVFALTTATGSATGTTQTQPPFATYWTQLNSGIKWNPTQGSFSALAGTNVIGTGTSATFNVTAKNTKYTVVVNAGGTGYNANDTIKILGTSLGGLSPANDLLITVNTVSSGVIQAGGVSVAGISVTWASGVSYVAGDVVMWGVSSYICTFAHIAATGNRPDNDLTGTYWNLLASGAESSVLTTQGDMFYYGANGPTRLPVGTDGQVLRVNSNQPAWQYYGQINNIVYVASNGVDTNTNGQGTTIDKPWATVRYACKQVEDGYLNPNSSALLAKNKQFMMKEISAWVVYNYSFNITGSSTSSFTVGAGSSYQTTTANMYVGMPIKFSDVGGGVTAGTTYYVQSIVDATHFTISTTSGGSALALTAGSVAMTGTLVYSASKAETDVGALVEAVVFDISHGGTSKSTAIAQGYFTSSGALITTTFAAQVQQVFASFNYLKNTLIANVLANTAPSTVYQTSIGISAGNQAKQIIDATLTSETSALATSQANLSIVTVALNAQTNSTIPAVIYPNTTVSVKTGTYNEVLPIVVPAYTAIVGDELRSTVVQPAGANLQLVNDKPKSVAALTRLQAIIPNLLTNATVTPTTGNTVTQVTTLPAGDVGSTVATASVKANAELMYDIVANGVSNVPTAPATISALTTTATSGTGTVATITFTSQAMPPYSAGQNVWVYGVTPTAYNGYWTVTACTTTTVSFASTATGSQTVAGTVTELAQAFTIPVVTGYNTASFLQGYGDGLAQIIRNYAYITAEISAYLNTNYNSIWTQIVQASCTRDLGYILDALQYDMTYGCNTQSLIAGSSYYSNYVSTIQATEKAATVAAYTRLKTIVGQIVQGQSVTPSAGNVTSQVTAGTAGTAGAATFAQARIQDIIDWINNGAANATVAPTAAIALTSSSLQTSYNALVAKRSEIQSDTTTWVQKFYQSLSFNIATCSRDAGYIVDALANDLVFGSNFNSITVGRSYNRAISSVTVVRTNQLAAELGAINFIKYKAKHIAAAGSVALATNAINDVVAFISNGSQPRFQWQDTYSAASANQLAAAKIIWANKAFIIAEVSSYLNTNYNSVWTSIVQAKCSRDIGYIIDALRYDMTYGGNWATLKAGKAYYSYVDGTFEIAAGEKTATLAAMTLISTIASALAQGGNYTPLQTTVPYVNGAVGTSTQGTLAASLMTYISNIITNGNTAGVPTITITTIASNTTFTSGTHGLSANDLVIPQSTANGLTSGQIYYVASTGLTSTQFQLSATWGGAALATFTNGTGLTIVAETNNLPATTNVSATLTGAHATLNGARSTIQASVLSYINTNYPSLVYTQATCSRDVGMILDAVGYDFMLGTNFQSVKSGMSYYEAQASKVIGAQKTATIASFVYLQAQIATTLANSSTASASATASLATIISIINTGVGESPEVHGTVTYNNTLSTIQGAEVLRANINFVANELSAYTAASFGGSVTTTATNGTITTAAAHNLSVGDPVQFSATTVNTTATATTVSTNYITVLSTAGMVVNMPIVFTGTAFGGLTSNTTYYIKTIVSGTQIVVSGTYPGTSGTSPTLSTASGTLTVVAGGLFGGMTAGTEYYVLTVPTSTTLTLSTVQAGAGTQTTTTFIAANGVAAITYYYSVAKCIRDTTAYINALIYDLQYTGNYKSLRAAQLYNNAVSGSQYQNMFLVRNSTGLRNMTLSGLNGYLTNANTYGTKRPTGGAFASLDPGFGPNDTNVWISGRSCYTQNCTMFGYACVGAKVDGALHAGGYRSMVANDYTTIIGDGIGYWVTGSNAVAELVSVFNYYGYAGYLAELGAKIRATNGNSSYGTYGVVAEGVDTFETAIYGTLNNRYFQAQIANVVTDATNQVLRFEYGNAGSNYTNTVHTISGSGYNATAAADEFRDASIFETRLIDLNDGKGSGGSQYVTATNVSQGGTNTYITIAATDTALTGAYAGMRIQLVAGTGVGQYANILTYANGTKVATLVKDSVAPLNITAATSTNNLLTVASTANLYVGMPIYVNTAYAGLSVSTPYYVLAANFSATQFAVSASPSPSTAQVTLSTVAGATLTVTATAITNNLITATNTLVAGQTVTFNSSFAGIDANTLYYVLGTNLSTASFAVSTTPNGSAVTITATGAASSTGTIGTALFAAGWDHVVPGTAILSSLDLTSGYIIEPRINYSAPAYASTARTLPSSATWTSVAYGDSKYVAVSSGGTATATSSDGKTWTAGGAQPSSQTWNSVVYGGGQGAKATAVVGGLGGTGATFTAVIGTGLYATQIVSITVTNGGYNYTTPPTIVITGGGGSGATATCTVLNGAIQNVTMVINGSGYSSVPTVAAATGALTSVTVNQWGKNYFSTPVITIAQPQGLSPVAFQTNTAYTTGQYVQTAAGRIYYVSNSGTTSVTTPSFDYTSSSQSQSVGTATFLYTATQAQATPTLTNAGVSAIVLGVNGYGYTTTPSVTILDSAAKFVAISSASTSAAYSTVANLGSTWTASGVLPASNLQALTYGNGVYIAVGGASGTATGASSTDGVTWITRTLTALSAGNYSGVVYGNGSYVAIQTGGVITSTSTNGVNWVAGGVLPASTTWTSIAYGNGRFVALAVTGAVAYSINNGVAWTAAPTAVGTTTSILSSSYTWSAVTYANGVFLAIAKGTTVCATSTDGINWTVRAMPSSSNWQAVTAGNVASATIGSQPLFVAVSNTSGTVAASIRTGATTTGRMKAASGSILEVRLIEPGSGYAKGNVTATTVTTNIVTSDDITGLSTSLANNQPIEFNTVSAGGLTLNTTYYVIGSSVTTTVAPAGTFQVTATAGSTTPVTLSTSAPTGMIYQAGPVVTQLDPNRVNTAPLRVRMGDGALGNPSFGNRGTNNATATASTQGDGYGDVYQNSAYINLANLYQMPSAGANVQFATITGNSQWYKLVAITNILGVPGNYTAQFQVNPALTTLLAPTHNTLVTTRLKYSQVRLTGHDFLYIGTGNQAQTNYPYVVPANASQANQQYMTGGGRVFFTSTDQDGNFNVGNLFGVQQSTGTATLNASAFNLAGLQSLQLGAVSLGVGSAVITQFSTDPYFTANSDNVVPTQKAIKSFITAQIGGGASTLNVNTITSGQIYIANNSISNTTGNQILVSSKMNFVGGIDGAPVALVFFGQK